MYNFKKLFTYMVVGALVIALSISCKNNDKTGSEGGISSIPTASGNAAIVGDATFTGTLNRTALNGISETDAESGTAPATLRVAPDSADNFQLEIAGNRVNSGILGALAGAQLLTSGDNKVVQASGEYSDSDSGMTMKEYIKITLDNASNPTTAQVEYQMGTSGNGIGFMATYTGNLTKQNQ